MENRSTLVLALTRELTRVSPDDPFPLRLCRAYTRCADADAGAISLGFTTSDRTVLCATDDVVSVFEDVQDALREGPTLEAFRTARPVTAASVDDQFERWPVLMRSIPPDVLAASLYAFPMLPESTLVGVVSLLVRQPRPLRRTHDELSFLADVVGAAIVGGVVEEDTERVLWSQRDKVAQATGMIVAQLGVDPDDALAILRAHAFAHEASVAETSRAVLAREIDFSDYR